MRAEEAGMAVVCCERESINRRPKMFCWLELETRKLTRQLGIDHEKQMIGAQRRRLESHNDVLQSSGSECGARTISAASIKLEKKGVSEVQPRWPGRLTTQPRSTVVWYQLGSINTYSMAVMPGEPGREDEKSTPPEPSQQLTLTPLVEHTITMWSGLSLRGELTTAN